MAFLQEVDMKNLVKTECKKTGIELSDYQAEQFERYYNLLLDWNEKINLTRITEKSEVALKHFADSLTLLNYYDIPQGAKLIDVGTGAGFPGIPLKIARPDIELTLLDSLNKRLIFLDEVCARLDIDANLVHSRAEDGGRNPKLRESFDLVVSRAVAGLNVLSEYCLPFVKVGGAFTPMKGPDAESEISEAESAIKLLGGKLSAANSFTLGSAGGRTIVVIDKVRSTPQKYPRHGSKIKSKPL